MADVVITDTEDEGEGLDDQAAHEAAVAQGAAQVHEEQAQQHATEADAAAEQAAAAAQATEQIAAASAEQTQQAEDAATAAILANEGIQQALAAQAAAIAALTEEIRASRTPAAPVEQEVAKAPDTEPAPRKRHWYYGER